MNLIIVSGLSGSGKTVALQALEDICYYCIDNLPANLLPHFASNLLESPSKQTSRVAIGIDVRNQHFLENLPDSLQQLKALGIDYRILYLSADDETLMRRFSETRRRHPLTDESTSLSDAIQLEHKLLTSLAQQAEFNIDTSSRTVHELRSEVRNLVGTRDGAGMMLQIVSFGHKHGHPGDVDFVFDVRCLPNPHWQEELRALTGLDQPVIDYLTGHAAVVDMIDDIYQFLNRWLSHFEEENRSYITIAIGCTGGRHRSVYIAEQLRERFADSGIPIQLRHRELM
jgi:UPF0042 nucleotide-binding protein